MSAETTTHARICLCIARVTLNWPVDLRPETRLVEDLDLDSLDVIELIMDIETEFGIEIDDQAVETAQTVADLAQMINRKAQAAK